MLISKNCFQFWKTDFYSHFEYNLLYFKFKVNESRYILLFVFSRSIKKLFSIDYVNIYLSSILFSIDFAWWKGVGLPHIPDIMIQ